MTKKFPVGLMWLRRDLRLIDNTALSQALTQCERVVVVFVFDSKILKRLKSRDDRRVSFIYQSICEMDHELQKANSRLVVKYGDPTQEIPKLIKEVKAGALFFNEDYEPYAKRRDKAVGTTLSKRGIPYFAFKDQVIFSGEEIKKGDGSPYRVFTPYKKKWLGQLSVSDYRKKKMASNYLEKKALRAFGKIPDLNEIGFEAVKEWPLRALRPGRKSALKALNGFFDHLTGYADKRNFPFLEDGTSGLSVHLRFGTISIRECVELSLRVRNAGAQTWLSELIWREFYQMILSQFPHVASGCFKPEYDEIKWANRRTYFNAWCRGETGFPIVDAGMRQLNQTGWMHNRVRMITASFLVKDLLIDWRKGEKYFADKLLDFDLASNNGGWQWCASTGCDAQPYFRIFNPSLQSQRFDPDAVYIKKWVPELEKCSAKDIHNAETVELFTQASYPSPLVDHSSQKKKALALFSSVRA